MNIVDLRSDTVTPPTPAMREAMASAVVGDDVYGDDPTVNRLQELAAGMLGKEAAILVPSGTMGNLASLLAHCGRGDEIIVGDLAHTFLYEAGGAAALGGIHPRQLRNQPDGTLALEEIRAAIRSDDAHFPPTRLIALENTHNRCKGVALTLDYQLAVRAIADEFGLILHLDGARLFNAAAALGVPAREVAAPFDSVTFCLSKGLSAPAGSLIAGTRPFIVKVHRARKMLGGGMRQAGIIAAAGIVALETMVDRLADDHARARELARRLSLIPALIVENEVPASNMVYLSLGEEVPLGGREISEGLLARGVKVGAVGHRRLRLVTHAWVGDADVAQAVAAFTDVLAG